MPDQYRHIPLPSSRSIRVLHLEPSQDRLAPLRCSLNAVSLDDYPKWDADYTALSYSWDAQRPSCEIECDGGNLLITSNCEAAIRELRDSTDIKILWIDSICIDQSSECIQERNSQVALMGEIYKSAAKVAVWLGESDNRVEIAIRHVMEIAAVPVIEDRESGRDARRVIRDRVRNIASSEFKFPSQECKQHDHFLTKFQRLAKLQRTQSVRFSSALGFTACGQCRRSRSPTSTGRYSAAAVQSFPGQI